jgi:hypothetical protein
MRWVCFLLVSAAGAAGAARVTAQAVAGRIALDQAQLVSRSDSSRVLAQGKPIGATVSAVRRTRDSLVYTERSALGGAFEQLTTIVLDPRDASVKDVVQTITQQGKTAETRLTYGNGRVKGLFQAYRVEVSGSRIPFVLYVGTATPRRIVKTEFVGQPFIVELVQ